MSGCLHKPEQSVLQTYWGGGWRGAGGGGGGAGE